MANEIRNAGGWDNDSRDQTAEHTLAANPLVGVRSQDIFDWRECSSAR